MGLCVVLDSWRSTGELLARETGIFPIRASEGAFKLPFSALPRWCAAVSVLAAYRNVSNLSKLSADDKDGMRICGRGSEQMVRSTTFFFHDDFIVHESSCCASHDRNS